MFRHGHFTYQVVGFVDRDPAWVGRRISGVPVLGTIDQTCQLAQRWGVQEILIAGGTPFWKRSAGVGGQKPADGTDGEGPAQL